MITTLDEDGSGAICKMPTSAATPKSNVPSMKTVGVKRDIYRGDAPKDGG